jgi:hypothetical protein
MTKYMFRLAVLIGVGALAATVSAQKADVPIHIVVEGRDVVVSGLMPGGNVAVVAAWWTRSNGVADHGQTWRDGKADAGGTLRVTFSRAVPAKALLAAVDVGTGRVEMRVGDPARYRRVELPEKRFKRSAERHVERVQLPHDFATIVLLRPRVGAWIQIVADGSAADSDERQDGLVSTDPARMRRLGSSPEAPKVITPRDILLLIDAAGGVYAQTEVTP